MIYEQNEHEHSRVGEYILFFLIFGRRVYYFRVGSARGRNWSPHKKYESFNFRFVYLFAQ